VGCRRCPPRRGPCTDVVGQLHTPRATQAILDKLHAQHPDADTELHYRNAFELLVATILSAQSTDQRVNMVTPALFAKYPDARALSGADPPDIERLILQTGFFRQKTKSIIGMSRALLAQHGGVVPADIDALVKLPGVGRKTANVVLGHALGVPGLPVDRHVLRVSNRIGIAEGDDPELVEKQLCSALPPDRWTRASDALILHGRRICRPKPLCDRCAVREDCVYYRTVVAPEAARASGARPQRSRKTKAVATPPATRPPAARSRRR
jgi:endonuclease-3